MSSYNPYRRGQHRPPFPNSHGGGFYSFGYPFIGGLLGGLLGNVIYPQSYYNPPIYPYYSYPPYFNPYQRYYY